MNILAVRTSLLAAFSPAEAPPVPAQWLALLGVGDDPQTTDKRFSRDLESVTPHLLRFARVLTRDIAAAEDLVQDALLRAWSARAQFIPGSNMRAWTSTIVRRVYLSGKRRAKFVGHYDEAVERTLAASDDQTIVVELQDVNGAMARLPTDQREALMLIGVEQVSYQHAADRLGIPIGTVKSRVTRARRALLAMIDGGHREDDGPDRPLAQQHAIDRYRTAKAANRPFLIG